MTITDDDVPAVTVSFGAASYAVAEGSSRTVTVELSADPERTVVIPIETTDQGGAIAADYSGVPPSVTMNAGQTTKTFEFMAMDDPSADTGKSVKLSFGTMPDARVSEGSPDEATVTIRQTSTTFSLTCMTSVWCADLGFADQSALDWGWAWLLHGNGIDPTSTLSDDSFTFRGVEYRVQRMNLRAGTYPTLANAWSREEQNRSRFAITFTPARQFALPSRDHYRDWVLHVAGLQLPFKDAFASDYGRFIWLDADLQELYNEWTTDTVTKIGIEEVAAADQPPNPAVPWLPMSFDASPSGPDELRISWLEPHWRPGLPAPTGYIVQWKLASAGWSDQDAVSEREVRSGRGGSVIVEGLTENMLYSARIFAFNDAGDGPVSDDALARTQGHNPRLESMSVNGSTLTMRYREQLDPPSAPATTSFVVLVEAGLREVTQVEVSGREVILTLAIPVHADNYVQARYEEPNDRMATFLRDTNGNHVESTSRRDTVPDVVNETPRMDLQPLTAGFSNLPSSHDGWAPFTFNVDFSDQVWISLGLPRDDMLEVEGGTVTTAHRVERLSRQWAVTIQPENRGDIVITLPGGFCTVLYDSSTAAMRVPGAPCAPGNRALSNQPTVTIPGPDSPQQQVVENSQAEGAPRIVGTPEVGQTLSADDTGIADADGLIGTVFSHQWLADAAEVAGATGSTHTLTDDDLGKAIKVRVTFTDDGGNEESLTSAATAAVTAAAGLELQSATVDGSTLTLTYNATLDTGVILPKTAFAVNVSGSSHLVVGAGLGQSSVLLSLSPAVEAGDTVTVDYTAPTDESAARLQDLSGNAASSFSGEAVTNDTAPPQAPLIPNDLQVTRHESGKLLASWTAPDSGPAPTGYTVQWKESGDDWGDQDDVTTADVTTTLHIVAGLTDGTEYAVRVIATTDGAEGPPSEEVAATPAETTPPELSSATVDGATLTLTFDEQLDTGETPDKTAFGVTLAGSGRGVDTVAVSGSMVILTLVTAVFAGDAVTVAYTGPTDDATARLQDLVGNAAASFSGQEVTNNTAPDQTEEPSQTEEESQEQADIPGSPTGLQVTRHESGKLLASWTAPDSGPAPSGYTVQWKESGDDWADQNDVSEADVTVTSHIVAGLTDGTEYAVRVIATTDDAEGPPSEEVTATPAETTPPELSSATVVGATLTLAYDEQLDIGEAPDRSAFAVTVAGSGRGVDTVAVSGSVVTLTLSPAVVAEDTVTVDYTAPTDESAARLQDLVGNAAASFSGQTVTNDTAPPQAPLIPNDLQVTRHESGKLLASWTAPDSGPAPTGYTVQWKESGDDWADQDDVSEADVTGASHIIAGLTDGTEYAVRVIATTDDAESDPSGEVTATPAETTPPELSSASVDGATLTLTFDEQLDTGETPDKTAFSVTLAGSGRGVDTVAVSGSMVILTLVTAVFAGDAVTVAYTAPTDDATARLQDLVGNAAASFSGQEVTNNTAPDQTEEPSQTEEESQEQADIPGSPTGLQVAQHESGKLLASWTAPDSGPAPTGYTVQWKESGDDWADQDDVSEADVTGASHIIGGLTDGTEYAVRVIATTDDAESDPSGEVTATPAETTPPELSSATVDGATLTLAYDEQLDIGEAPDRSAFAVTVAGSGRGVDTVAVSGSAVTLTLVTAVVAGDTVAVDYTAPTDESAARLQDLSGNAAESFSGQAVTNNAPPPQAPLIPNDLQVARHESGKLLASWTGPDSGPAPTGYTVQWKESGDDWADQDDVSEADVTGASHIIAGLTDGTEYAVRVIATTDGAEGPPSEEVAATPAETTAPEISSASVDGARLTLTFDEALDTGETPDRTVFAVAVGDSGRGVDTVAVSSSVVIPISTA